METPVTFDHLCEICESLFDDHISEYILSNGTTSYTKEWLQSNFDEIIRSAEEGCHICNILCRSYFPFKFSNLQSLSLFRGVEVVRSFGYDIRLGYFFMETSCKGVVGLPRAAAISRVVSRVGPNSQDSEGLGSITDD